MHPAHLHGTCGTETARRHTSDGGTESGAHACLARQQNFVKSLSLDGVRPGPTRVLCLGAHSDDIEIGCGATLLTMLRVNPETEVQWVVFGARGPREDEARRSADQMLAGAKRSDIAVLGFRDSFFPYDGAAIKSQFEEYRAVRARPHFHASGRRPASGSSGHLGTDVEYLSRSPRPRVRDSQVRRRSGPTERLRPCRRRSTGAKDRGSHGCLSHTARQGMVLARHVRWADAHSRNRMCFADRIRRRLSCAQGHAERLTRSRFSFRLIS